MGTAREDTRENSEISFVLILKRCHRVVVVILMQTQGHFLLPSESVQINRVPSINASLLTSPNIQSRLWKFRVPSNVGETPPHDPDNRGGGGGRGTPLVVVKG